MFCFFFFSSRRRHTILQGDWSSDVCSSDLGHGELRGKNRLGLWRNVAVRMGFAEIFQVDTAALRSRSPRMPRGQPQPGSCRSRQIGRASCRERVEMSYVNNSLYEEQRALEL